MYVIYFWLSVISFSIWQETRKKNNLHYRFREDLLQIYSCSSSLFNLLAPVSDIERTPPPTFSDRFYVILKIMLTLYTVI